MSKLWVMSGLSRSLHEDLNSMPRAPKESSSLCRESNSSRSTWQGGREGVGGLP